MVRPVMPGLRRRPDKEKTPGFTGVDAAFACGFLAVGWLFWELQLWSGWRWFGNAGTGTALFTALLQARYWLCILQAAPARKAGSGWRYCLPGLGYALPYGGGLLGAVHYGALLFTAGYWTLSATGRLLKSGKTSNWLPLDVLNVLFVLPWGNFMRLPAAFVFGLKGLGRRVRAARSEPGERSRGNACWGCWAAWRWRCCACACAAAAADGGRRRLCIAAFGFCRPPCRMVFRLEDSWTEFVVKVFLRCPRLCTCMALYGAVRGTPRLCLRQKGGVRGAAGLRFAPRSTVLTALFVLCAVYLLFISMQAKYLFGAFGAHCLRDFLIPVCASGL